MTPEELQALLLKMNPLAHENDLIWKHDQQQRDELARLRDIADKACGLLWAKTEESEPAHTWAKEQLAALKEGA